MTTTTADTTTTTFSALIVHTAREHEALVEQLHAAADAVGVSHDDADALLFAEADAGPAVKPCDFCYCTGCTACETNDGTEDGSFCLCAETKNHVPNFGPA